MTWANMLVGPAILTGWELVVARLLATPWVGVMPTPSVNVVQSAFPENLQGEISGLSRSVSNLGSSFGTRSRALSWSRARPTPAGPTGSP